MTRRTTAISDPSHKLQFIAHEFHNQNTHKRSSTFPLPVLTREKSRIIFQRAQNHLLPLTNLSYIDGKHLGHKNNKFIVKKKNLVIFWGIRTKT